MSNRLKQIALGHVQLFDNWPPGLSADSNRAFRGGGGVFSSLLPYLENPGPLPTPNGLAIKFYMSPSDPSFAAFTNNDGNCSFAVNARLYLGSGRIEDITDGTSNTIAFSERYARCRRQGVSWSVGQVICRNGITGQPVLCGADDDRRANFADDTFTHILPLTAGLPPTTIASVPGWTFQSNPIPTECDGWVVQSSLPGGLLVALADGSVRKISPGIAETVFWAAVTPNAGEVAHLE